ncbi:MAG: hypothetical protein E4H20_09395 [Spirochaetales bacterium]|nr:MAG: hypothetical protein E4H20_09395 [Spirochaetales bacterium]
MAEISVSVLISIISNGIKAINTIVIKKTEEKAVLEEVLEELKLNMKRINENYLIKKCSVESIISVLSTNSMDEAEKLRKRRKVDLNKIKSGLIELDSFINKHQIRYYQNYDTEKLLLKIREKIHDIQDIKKLHFVDKKWETNVNPKRRMQNLMDLFALASKHLIKK